MAERRPRLLIGDDEALNIRMLDEMLRDRYDIAVALNGEAVLKRAIASPPDLILLDIEMPDMDGYEVVRRLSENEVTQGIPVIFVTSRDDEEDERRGLELGAVDYIIKPFRPPLLLARLRNHLELKRQRDLLNRLSETDGLTGIANRRQFDRVLEREWSRAQRTGGEIALLLMDIDHFKAYNDNYGHTAGDECLKQIARVLAGCSRRPGDLVARYGGEEFACILSETDGDGAVKLAHSIHQAVLDETIPHAFSKVHDIVTLSLGVATIRPSEGRRSASDLIVAADRMLYRAKDNGRNRIEAGNAVLPNAVAVPRSSTRGTNRRPRLLLVDDEPLNISVLDTILRDECDIVAATDGELALIRAQSDPPPDMVLLDVQMPGLNGYEVCRRLKADPVTRDIPILFITVLADGQSEKTGLDLGAVDYITKPFQPASVQARVRTHLRMQRIHAQLGEKTAALEKVLAQRDQVERIKRHDLKRPLSRILDYVGALEGEVVPPRVADVTRRIEREVFSLMETINRTLYLWRLEQGVYVVDPKPVDLIPLLRRVVRSCADETTAAVELLVDGRPVEEADSFIVPGEELLCHSLLANLLQNALEASPIDAPVSVGLVDEAGRSRVIIRNQGAIPAEVRGHFLQAGVISHKPGGSGLGGYAARVIADAMGATIAFETGEDTGTSVFVDWLAPVAGDGPPATVRRDSLQTAD